MSRYRKLTTACLAAALALGLAACGGGGSSTTAPPGGGTPPTPTPKTGSVGSIPQTTGIAVAVATSETRTIAAGGMAYIGGVKFSCAAGDTGCDLTLTKDSDGTVTGAWSGAAVTAEFVDPLENMNEANHAKIQAQMMRIIGARAVDTTNDDTNDDVPGVSDDAILGGLGDGMIGDHKVTGLGADSITSATLTERLDPNGPAFDATALATSPGSTVTVKDDAISADMAGALGRAGWDHNVLHADWGDTKAPNRDGGFETAALIYSDIMAPESAQFNATTNEAGTLIASATIRPWFTLDTDGKVAGFSTNDSAERAGALTFSPDGQQFASGRLTVLNNDTVRGTYFGAPGVFKCVTGTGCYIARDPGSTGPFKVSDENGADTAGFGEAGSWEFTPDADAAIMLPDQDWMAFGVWLTAPDNKANGEHDIGVFYNGMENYSNAGDSTLDGTAKYTGDAAGYYVNGAEHGLFTATASLTATFAAGETDSLEGSINDFRDSQGRYIDSDNDATPNDPLKGGEGDWVVLLTSANIGTNGAVTGGITGSADGIRWMQNGSGNWTAQLYGPGGRLTTVVAPSGVAGNFRAITGNLGTADAPSYKGVVGAFGAPRSSWTAD